MAGRIGKKRAIISISSSSEDEQSPKQSSSSSSEDHHHHGSAEDISASTSSDDDNCDDDDDDWSGRSESDNGHSEKEESADKEDFDRDDDESVCDRVIRLLQERSDMQELSLIECKSYLRRHGLRLSGTRVECIQRIKEHWRIKYGNGEALYPRSSFIINCTGDVCKGDVVLFIQKVYEKFDKVTRRGNTLGKRTIAGRVVKESYGAAKQQHTFTVEVLWSKGVKKLPPLFPLLVKGRNLYKLKTFRQCWKNEAERSRVLSEKHQRGAAARLVRAMKKRKSAASSTNEGVKRQKQSHHTRPTQVRQPTKRKKGKCIDQRGKASKRTVKPNNHHQKPHPLSQVNSKQTRAPTSHRRHENFINPNEARYPTFQSHTYFPQHFQHTHLGFHHQIAPLCFTSSAGASTSSTTWLPHFRPYAASPLMSASERQEFRHGNDLYNSYEHPSCIFEPRNSNRFPGLNIYRPPHSFG